MTAVKRITVEFIDMDGYTDQSMWLDSIEEDVCSAIGERDGFILDCKIDTAYEPNQIVAGHLYVR